VQVPGHRSGLLRSSGPGRWLRPGCQVTATVLQCYSAVTCLFTPSPLWPCRYSLFYVLYPTGITSELGLTYLALPSLKVSDVYCTARTVPYALYYVYCTSSINTRVDCSTLIRHDKTV